MYSSYCCTTHTRYQGAERLYEALFSPTSVHLCWRYSSAGLTLDFGLFTSWQRTRQHIDTTQDLVHVHAAPEEHSVHQIAATQSQ